MLTRQRQRGDTIIEVILAFAVFGMLAVGTIALMNRGTQASQQALESTLTQELIAGQAESLRFLRESYMADPSSSGPAAEFEDIVTNNLVDSPSQFGNQNCTSDIPDDAFAINPDNASVIPAEPMNSANAPAYPQVTTVSGNTRAYGLWIEAVRNPSAPTDQPRFIDFHIRACWFSATASSIPSTTGTIVRLYLPDSDLYADSDGSGSAPTTPGPTTASVVVVVEKIPQVYPNGSTSNPTPSCSLPATQNRSGTSVTVDGVTQTTNNTQSSATFDNLNRNTYYNIGLNAPTGYQLCPGGTNTASTTITTGDGGAISTVNTYKIRPVCTTYQVAVGSHAERGAYRGQFNYGGIYNSTSSGPLWSDTVYNNGLVWMQYTGVSPWSGAYTHNVWTGSWVSDYETRYSCPS